MGKARSKVQSTELEKHLQQLQLMGQLRNFDSIIDEAMESESLHEHISIERTSFYKQGFKAAEAKAEARHQKEEEARRTQEEARRKEAEARQYALEKKEERLIAALLLNNAMGKEQVAALVDVPLQKVEETVVKIEKSHTLLMTHILTFEEIAAKMQVSVDFVKTVANAPNSLVDNA